MKKNPLQSDVHLGIVRVLWNQLVPSGTRTNKIQEANWRLKAAIEALRGTEDVSVLGECTPAAYFGVRGNSPVTDTHLSLSQEDSEYLTSVCEEEMSRISAVVQCMLILTLQAESLHHEHLSYEGLVTAIKEYAKRVSLVTR